MDNRGVERKLLAGKDLRDQFGRGIEYFYTTLRTRCRIIW
jgi:hypothetical protein